MLVDAGYLGLGRRLRSGAAAARIARAVESLAVSPRCEDRQVTGRRYIGSARCRTCVKRYAYDLALAVVDPILQQPKVQSEIVVQYCSEMIDGSD